MGSCRYSASCSMSGLTLRRRDQLCTVSLDHLVGTGEKGERDLKAKRLRGLEIDHQFELGGLLHGQVSRLGTPEDLTSIEPNDAKKVGKVRSEGDQTPSFGKFTSEIQCQDRLLGRQGDELMTIPNSGQQSPSYFSRVGLTRTVP